MVVVVLVLGFGFGFGGTGKRHRTEGTEETEDMEGWGVTLLGGSKFFGDRSNVIAGSSNEVSDLSLAFACSLRWLPSKVGRSSF